MKYTQELEIEFFKLFYQYVLCGIFERIRTWNYDILIIKHN